MRRRPTLAVFACLLLLANQASAHRLDEYLQATIISLQADYLDVSMRLIPGVSIAPAVIAAIDGNGDGVLSATEQRTYAERVLADLWVTIDGKSVQPHLASYDFPQPAEMRQGLGEIHIEYSAELPRSDADHSLVIVNHHSARVRYTSSMRKSPATPVFASSRRNEMRNRQCMSWTTNSPVPLCLQEHRRVCVSGSTASSL
jgi:hypothetical protein